jgi:hypothetical protein
MRSFAIGYFAVDWNSRPPSFAEKRSVASPVVSTNALAKA